MWATISAAGPPSARESVLIGGRARSERVPPNRRLLDADPCPRSQSFALPHVNAEAASLVITSGVANRLTQDLQQPSRSLSQGSPSAEGYHAVPTCEDDVGETRGPEMLFLDFNVDADGDLEAKPAICGLGEQVRRNTKIMLTDPSSSSWGAAWQYLSFILILASVAIAILETVPEFESNVVFMISEPIFTVYFSVEIFLRIWTCDSYREFFTNVFNIIDVVATVPCYADLLLMPFGALAKRDLAGRMSASFQALRLADLVHMVRVVRLLRILRVANTMRQSEMISVVIKSVWGSLSGIWVLNAFMLVGMILAATMVYLVEMGSDSSFHSIPISIWWAATTITAVGYGDLIPRTVAGKGIAMCTMFLGVIIMAVCIAVVTNSFTIEFQREMYASRIRGIQRKAMQHQISGPTPSTSTATPSPKRGRSNARHPTDGGIPAKIGSGFGGAVTEEQLDFATCVNQLEEMAEALLLGFESLAGPNEQKDASSRASADHARCTRMIIENLRKSNRLWFEQAKALSEELLSVADGCDVSPVALQAFHKLA